jgi:hypothetical protein
MIKSISMLSNFFRLHHIEKFDKDAFLIAGLSFRASSANDKQEKKVIIMLLWRGVFLSNAASPYCHCHVFMVSLKLHFDTFSLEISELCRITFL